MNKKNVITAAIRDNPLMSNRDIASLVGCSRRHVRRVKQALNFNNINKPKQRILLFDIETLPMEVYVWGLYKQRIPADNIIADWCVLGWSAKWLFESEIMSDVLTPDEARDKDDSRILEGIWELLDEATIVIAHNGNNFDLRKLNFRFALSDMIPPSPYVSIDTLKESRKAFGASSHTLDYLSNTFNNSGKLKTSFSLWIKCCHGDHDALNQMEIYNRQDVVILEDFYLKLRPWIKPHPNIGLYTTDEFGESACPACGSTNIVDTGNYQTQVNLYTAYRCLDCGSLGRSRKSIVKNKEILHSVAR